MSTATDTRIKIERPSKELLEELKVFSWSIWTKEQSSFEWEYDQQEICYFLEGDVTVSTDRGEVSFGKGDLVTFPKGLSCKWHIKTPVRKHYLFG